jgi:flagellar basal-body rod protein FlgC
MDLSSIDISAAGLRVQRAHMDLIAANLANVDTTSVREEAVRAEDGREEIRHVPYRRRVATIVRGADGLPSIRVSEDASPFRSERRPGHPHASADGTVELPNVDPMVETIDLLAASRAYEANLTAAEVAKSMCHAALRILG